MVKLLVMSAAYRQDSRAPARAPRGRPEQSPARLPVAPAARGRVRPRQRAGDRGPAQPGHGRPERLPLPAPRLLRQHPVPRPRLRGRSGRPPVPPGRLHALAAHVPPADAGQLRRPPARGVHRRPDRRQHAPAGPHAAQRPHVRRGRAGPGPVAPGDDRTVRTRTGSSGSTRRPWRDRPASASGNRCSSSSPPAASSSAAIPRRPVSSSTSATRPLPRASTNPSWRRGPRSAESCWACTRRSPGIDP